MWDCLMNMLTMLLVTVVHSSTSSIGLIAIITINTITTITIIIYITISISNDQVVRAYLELLQTVRGLSVILPLVARSSLLYSKATIII